MQQALLFHNPRVFMDELNEHLLNGCRIVPGTFYAGSLERMPADRTPGWAVLQNGKALDAVYFCVLELPCDANVSMSMTS